MARRMSTPIDIDFDIIHLYGHNARPQVVFMDGIGGELTIYPGKNVTVNGAQVMRNTGTVPVVFRWPVVPDANGVCRTYNREINISGAIGSTADPVATLLKYRQIR